jgi:hypothetical protein
VFVQYSRKCSESKKAFLQPLSFDCELPALTLDSSTPLHFRSSTLLRVFCTSVHCTGDRATVRSHHVWNSFRSTIKSVPILFHRWVCYYIHSYRKRDDQVGIFFVSIVFKWVVLRVRVVTGRRAVLRASLIFLVVNTNFLVLLALYYSTTCSRASSTGMVAEARFLLVEVGSLAVNSIERQLSSTRERWIHYIDFSAPTN